MRRFIFLLLLILMMQSAFATIDLLNPLDEEIRGEVNVTFEYYASLEGLSSCTVFVDTFTFPDLSPENGINEVGVASIENGAHTWNVSCTGTNITEHSVQRTFSIDTIPPTVTIVSPTGGEANSIALDILPTDDQASTLYCTITWNDEELESVHIASGTHYQVTYTVQPATSTLDVLCTDEAENEGTAHVNLTVVPNLFLTLSTDKTTYGVTEPVLLTVDSMPGATVTVDICPNKQGFVQCVTALIENNNFPQTITMPYMNKTGEYLIDGIAQFDDQVVSAQTTYTLENTLTVDFTLSGTPAVNETVNLTAVVSGGIAPYTFTWNISNGSIFKDIPIVGISFNATNGNTTYNVTLIAEDAAQNIRSITKTIELDEEHDVIFEVKDNKTGEPILGADIQFNDVKRRSSVGGLTIFTARSGTYQLFASAPGYTYVLEDIDIIGPVTRPLFMHPTDGGPSVTLFTPENTNPVHIRFNVTHATTCTLLLGTEELLENGTVNATSNEFVRELADGEYQASVSCVDVLGRKGTAEPLTFTIGTIEETVEDPLFDSTVLDQTNQELATLLESFTHYEQQEQDAIEILQIDKKIRNTRRAIQQAIRDSNSVQFRTDFSPEQKTAEYDAIRQRILATIANTPRSVEVLDTNSYVQYVNERDVDTVVEELLGLNGMPEDPKRFRKLILDDQQKFTVDSKVMHVEHGYSNGTTRVATIVQRSFTYAGEEDYAIVEILPKKVIRDADDILFVTEAEVLKQDPVLRFGKEDVITYVLPKKVSFTRMKEVKTVLTRTYTINKVTGFVIFSGSLGQYGLYIGVLLGIIILLYLCYYFDVLKQAQYILYKFRKNEQVHYLRVLLHDIQDHLAATNYDKAELLYKEVRMSYDVLPPLAQNDLHEDVMDIVRQMDAYYFNMIMIEIDHHLKANEMHAAIASYEKLIGTFERLDRPHQEELVQTVTAMAKRLGVAT